MNASGARLLLCVAVGLLGRTAPADVFHMGPGLTSLETVPVGNPRNAGELSGRGAGGLGSDRICGAVGYTCRMSKYELTAGQYCEFLNAVAKTDAYGLYSPYMDYDANPRWYGCDIKRGESPGGYTYTVAPDRANRPVNWLSWGDAARFCNWLANGQPTGVLTGNPALDSGLTEDGSYALNGATTGAALIAVTRKANATWVIPSEDEWYKAAYHKNDGATGNYFNFPTSSDAMPTNILGDPTDPGNSATYYDYLGIGNGTYTIGGPYWRTEAGAHENSASPYGTFDQGGNVWEWNEGVMGSARCMRGGTFSYGTGGDYLRASYRSYGYTPTYEHYVIGFRLAFVPEPTTIALLGLGAIGAWIRRRASRT